MHLNRESLLLRASIYTDQVTSEVVVRTRVSSQSIKDAFAIYQSAQLIRLCHLFEHSKGLGG